MISKIMAYRMKLSCYTIISLLLLNACVYSSTDNTTHSIEPIAISKPTSRINVDYRLIHGKNYNLYFSSEQPKNFLDHLKWQVSNTQKQLKLRSINSWFLHLFLKETDTNCSYISKAFISNNINLEKKFEQEGIAPSKQLSSNQLFEFFKNKKMILYLNKEQLKQGDIIFWRTKKMNVAVISDLNPYHNKNLIIANQGEGPLLYEDINTEDQLMVVRLPYNH